MRGRRRDGHCCNGHDLAVEGVRPSGGCRACGRTRKAKYQASPRGRELRKVWGQRYRATPNGREVQGRGRTRFRASEGGRACRVRYESSEKGRLVVEQHRLNEIHKRLVGQIASKKQLIADLETELAGLEAAIERMVGDAAQD